MSWNGKDETLASITERGFELEVNGGKVPGVYWSPEGGSDRLVLLGHGGTAHKKAEYIVEVAKLLAEKGIASMAIDGPGHGDRALSDDMSDFAKIWKEGGGTEGMLADWRAALDFMEQEFSARPTGWWGLSMGTMMGLPVVATDERIKVAQLGLMGTWGPNAEFLAEYAPQVSCPIRFFVQWDDEIVPRDKCLELFTLIGSKRKTLHANPGAHSAVPTGEIKGSVEYLDRYLA